MTSVGTAPAGSSLAVDASVIVALLVDQGPAGAWAVTQCQGHRLIAPSLLTYEVANVLRRQLRAGLIGADRARAAHRAAVELRVDLWPYRGIAERVWALRDTLTSYDASYCAVAELAKVRLVTLDSKLAMASGPLCEIRVFGPSG